MFTSGIEQLAKAHYNMLLQEMEAEQRTRKARVNFSELCARVLVK